MPPCLLHYYITSIRVRLAGIRSGELDRGALSIEWVVIAVALVAAATVVYHYVSTWVAANDSKITNAP
jgi:hypothetical protein